MQQKHVPASLLLLHDRKCQKTVLAMRHASTISSCTYFPLGIINICIIPLEEWKLFEKKKGTPVSSKENTSHYLSNENIPFRSPSDFPSVFLWFRFLRRGQTRLCTRIIFTVFSVTVSFFTWHNTRFRQISECPTRFWQRIYRRSTFLSFRFGIDIFQALGYSIGTLQISEVQFLF